MKNLRLFAFLGSLACISLIAVILNACANPRQTARDEGVLVQQEIIMPARTLSGNYLAGRFAQRVQDWTAAQKYMNAAIRFDRDNESMQQRAFLLSVAGGNHGDARYLAEKIAAGPSPELATIYLTCDALAREDYAAAEAHISTLPEDGFGHYTKPLLTAWTYAGQGRTEDALALLADDTAAEEDSTFDIHAGLINELAGRPEAAEARYRAAMDKGLTAHSAMLIGNFLMTQSRAKDAAEVYASLRDLDFDVEENGKTAEPNIRRPSDGASIVLFDLATLLFERRAYDSAQIYTSMAELLNPRSAPVVIMSGDILVNAGNYDTALQAYGRVAKDSPLFWMAQARIAETHEAAGDTGKAIELLTALARNPANRLHALAALGDIHSRNKDYAAALAAYDAALDGVEEIGPEHWPLVYARGMTLERTGEWEQAERDLMAALEYQPDNPLILNYIGYTWAEKGVNLDRALEYTRRAATLSPHDGYILDSYGWTLYKHGDYAEAVKWLEKAALLVPDDSTILDHLGDAYWSQGRRNEAKFKWRHAFGVSQDAGLKTALQQKILHGKPLSSSVAVKQETPLLP